MSEDTTEITAIPRALESYPSDAVVLIVATTAYAGWEAARHYVSGHSQFATGIGSNSTAT